MDAVHLLFSGAAAAGAAAFMVAAPAALDARWAPPADGDAAAAADLLACVAAGFYGFQLWALVRHRCAMLIRSFSMQGEACVRARSKRLPLLFRGLTRNGALCGGCIEAV